MLVVTIYFIVNITFKWDFSYIKSILLFLRMSSGHFVINVNCQLSCRNCVSIFYFYFLFCVRYCDTWNYITLKKNKKEKKTKWEKGKRENILCCGGTTLTIWQQQDWIWKQAENIYTWWNLFNQPWLVHPLKGITQRKPVKIYI